MNELRRLVRVLAPHRWQVAAAVILGAATVGSGVGLMGTAAFLIASAALHPSIAELQVAIVGVRFFGLSRGIFRYLERLVSHQLTLRLLGRLRVWFYRSLEPLAPARTLEMRSGDLLARAVTDVESLHELFIRAVAPPLVAAVVATGAGLVVASYDGRLACGFVIAFAASAVAAPLGVIRLGMLAEPPPSIRAELAAALVDGVQGMADVVAFGQAGRQRRRVEDLSLEVVSRRERAARIEALGTAATTFATHAAVWIVLVLAIPMLGKGGLTGVDLAVVCLVVLAAFEAVQPLPAAARGLVDQLAAARRIFTIVDARPAVVDPELPVALGTGRSGTAAGPLLELRRLSFTYPGSARPALCDVDLAVGAGRRIAVVGPSGAGKSTLAHLAVRFWDPSAGEIRLADRPLSAYSLDVLRSVVGILPQRTDLYTGTIRSNLLVAEPDADQSALERVADQAELLTTIRALPDGWDTWIGEQGLQLSGGQRRRLAVARMLLRAPSLMVLDEPTSGLDPLTAQRMMNTLLALVEGRTTVVITHRLVAMERFDEIVVLDRGRIVERGRHDRLLRCGGLYRALHDAQMFELTS